MIIRKQNGLRVDNRFREKVSAQGQLIQSRFLLDTVQLGVPDGPLEKFTGVMLKLQSKLKPVNGMKGVGKRLVWSFDKGKSFEYLIPCL